MNKEELKTGIENMDSVDLEIYKVKEVPDEGEKIKFIVKEDVLDLIDQLEEPEKVVVPQFVADWFDSRDINQLDSTIAFYCNARMSVSVSEYDDFDNWFSDDNNKPIETLIKMKLYGYEIEKTLLFHMPLPYQSNSTIYYYKQGDGKISFKQGGMMKDHSKFTQEELDKYFPEIKHMAEEVQE